MITENEIKEEDWPPKTIGGVIYNFLSFADDDEFNLVLEIPKKRIPWLAKNIATTIRKEAGLLENNQTLLKNLGNKNMSEEEAILEITKHIWNYINSNYK